MTAPRDMESICVTLESLLRLANSEVQEMRKTLHPLPTATAAAIWEDVRNAERRSKQITDSARAVLALRNADDVAFRAAVTVLVTDILGAGCWDSSNNETETKP